MMLTMATLLQKGTDARTIPRVHNARGEENVKHIIYPVQ